MPPSIQAGVQGSKGLIHISVSLAPSVPNFSWIQNDASSSLPSGLTTYLRIFIFI